MLEFLTCNDNFNATIATCYNGTTTVEGYIWIGAIILFILFYYYMITHFTEF